MQQRLRNYQHNILSFEHNQFNFGLHSAGRYMGFDTMVSLSGLTFNLAHTVRNLEYMNPNSDVFGPLGIYMTPQGTLIQEDGVIGPFTIASNFGNAFLRYDLIYANHDQVEVGGGQDATYLILKGNIGDSSKPQVPNPFKQTALGWVRIPPNEGTDINNCQWVKAKCPDSGDGPDARLDLINIFNKFQGYKLADGTLTTPASTVPLAGIDRSFWVLPTDGNSFRILPPGPTIYNLDAIAFDEMPGLQEGFRVYITFNEFIKVRQVDTALTDPQVVSGFRTFLFSPEYINNTDGITPSTGELWELELLYIGGYWVVQKIGGSQLKLTNPNSILYPDNITQVLGTFPNQQLYTPNPILYTGRFHIGDLLDPGIDYTVTFGGAALPTPYLVIGSLFSAGSDVNADTTGVISIRNKISSSFTLHVNEYAHDNTQDLWYEFMVVRLG